MRRALCWVRSTSPSAANICVPNWAVQGLAARPCIYDFQAKAVTSSVGNITFDLPLVRGAGLLPIGLGEGLGVKKVNDLTQMYV